MNLEHTFALLARTPAALNALLRDLPGDWTRRDEGTGTWTPYDIVGHLVHGERADWLARATLIREFGETRPFERFDRTAMFRESAGKPLADLLDEFSTLRERNLREVSGWSLGPDDLSRRGQHPSFGAVTLSQLLSAWAAHDLTHLHQLSRVLAYQLREAVGPWQAYLGVLHCQGHGG
jgi:hypothetical protein